MSPIKGKYAIVGVGERIEDSGVEKKRHYLLPCRLVRGRGFEECGWMSLQRSSSARSAVS